MKKRVDTLEPQVIKERLLQLKQDMENILVAVKIPTPVFYLGGKDQCLGVNVSGILVDDLEKIVEIVKCEIKVLRIHRTKEYLWLRHKIGPKTPIHTRFAEAAEHLRKAREIGYEELLSFTSTDVQCAFHYCSIKYSKVFFAGKIKCTTEHEYKAVLRYFEKHQRSKYVMESTEQFTIHVQLVGFVCPKTLLTVVDDEYIARQQNAPRVNLPYRQVAQAPRIVNY